ncbi:hypothetical protein MHU86_12677 [Fragilaria crotonensis]|nr:hypothetical protein MHU86_12677 [Fragilaria crotonensis]
MPTRHRRLLPQERPGVAISATRAPAGASDPKHSRVPCCLCGDDRGIPRRGRVDGRRRSAQSGDSTSAAGWLAKSNFNDDCPLHLTIARAFADFCLTHEIDHYTQWFPGKENKVADMLSRDFALDDAALTDLITKNCSPFVPQNFRIIPLRPALISQIGGWLQLLPKTQLLPTQPVPSAIAAGAVTKDSSDESTESEEPFLKDSDEKRKQKRSPASPPPFGTDGFAPDNLRKLAMDPCPVPFVPPSTVWLRPSGLTNLRAQSTTPPDDSTPSGFTTETLRRRGPRTYPTAGAAVRGDSKGSILGKKRDGHRYWTTCGGRVLFRHEVVRIFRCRKPTDDISDQSGRRSFPTEGQDLQTTDRGQLENADTVSITFRRQKNGDKGATVTQHRNDRQGQTDICPVRVLADLTTRYGVTIAIHGRTRRLTPSGRRTQTNPNTSLPSPY